MPTREVAVPDIGQFKNIPIIEVLVKAGDVVAKDTPLVTLESDKATIDVPSPFAGTIKELKVKLGDRVSQGSVLVLLDVAEGGAEAPGKAKPESKPAAAPASAPAANGAKAAPSSGASAPAAAATSAHAAGAPAVAPGTGAAKHPEAKHHADVLVLGAGPGGYTAAFPPPTSARRWSWSSATRASAACA